MTFDLLIRDGTIIDGTGTPRFRADLGISDGLIRDVGNPSLAGAAAAKTIAAAGKFVTPGFIDITSHADKNGSFFLNPEQDYLLTQGVTTTLVGNCGTSLAPLASREAAVALRKWGSGADININWQTTNELLGELARHPIGINIATLVGHGMLRRGILKDETRPLTLEELGQAGELLAASMREGAFGLSTGLAFSHESAAAPNELSHLAKVVGGLNGVYKTHLRNEGRGLVPALNETIQIARGTKARVVISHFKAIGRKSWPLFRRGIQMMERVDEGNAQMHFDISPYLRTGSFLYLLLPAWAREGGFAAMLKRLEALETRQTIIGELRAATLHYERYIVANSLTPNVNGRTLAEVAEHTGQSPEETILELLLSNRGRLTVFGRTLSYKNLATGLAHPLGIIASDGSGVFAELGKAGVLVHPRSTGAFTHFLHRFVREKELVSWEEGIRKITGLPAEVVGFAKRGRIAAGYHADIVVFDPGTIADHSTYQSPYAHSTGIEAVAVNGELAIEGGELTGTAAGQVLKKNP